MDYIFGICVRRTCNLHHAIVSCSRRTCVNFTRCKYTHLSGEDAQDIRNNVRPWNEIQMREVERLAFAMLNSLNEETRKKTCARFFTGLFCSHNCEACISIINDERGKLHYCYFT